MLATARHDYAVRALVELAEDDGPLTSEELAERGEMPHRFLWAILTDLTRAELVVSQRGKGGGYRLARSGDAITVADVIAALDGSVAAHERDGPLVPLWVRLRSAYLGEAAGITIAALASTRV